MLILALAAWSLVVLALGWRLGRGNRRSLTSKEWLDAYLLGTGEGAAELVTQLLTDDPPQIRIDPARRAK